MRGWFLDKWSVKQKTVDRPKQTLSLGTGLVRYATVSRPSCPLEPEYRPTMTRAELTAVIAQRFAGLGYQDADLAVKLILETIARTLSQGGRVEIRGFGTFGLNYRRARIARNPKTGEKVPVAGRYLPHFKAGKALREAVEGSWDR